MSVASILGPLMFGLVFVFLFRDYELCVEASQRGGTIEGEDLKLRIITQV